MRQTHFARRDVLYCEGPGDIVASFQNWRAGVDDVSETSITFSAQIFNLCNAEGLSLLAISHCSKDETLFAGNFTLANLPRRQIRLPRIGFHLSMFLYALRLLRISLRVRPRYILLSSGVVGFTFASLLKLSGAKIVFILHNAVWPEGYPPRGIRAWLRGLGRRLVWKYCVWHTLAVSPAAQRQVAKIIGQPPSLASATVFQPSFPRADFLASPSLPNFAARPFRVLYSSRVEENKGAFDLLSIAQSLPNGQFEFHVCGDGAASDELNRQVRLRGLEGIIRIHGRLTRPALLQQYLAAHAVIVPTRSTVAEGFAMVVAEAVLLRRPVVTCSVVPAAEVLRSAVLLANAGDVQDYAAALLRLSSDEVLYRHLVAQSEQFQQSLLDQSASLLATLTWLLAPAVLQPVPDFDAEEDEVLADGADA